jgi:uncharacterized membrane protein YjjB (DUF3815 family)
MSISPGTPPPSLPPQQRSGCVTAFIVVAGIILLLPGLCALVFGGMSLTGGSFPSDIISFIMTGLLVGALGVVVIWYAIRGPRS